ncbi:MAG: hypothetical protein A3A80_02860 [Candidatus Terrybacteria bacterium RIFCSPLOWO2_01_FULL_44_24]|nr:MAG: hypothetical protein A3B75_00350 [Candidatus Terrybacteria bacterium RIFCSPHIGHO2_02_FULL_43_14]OHA51009.1 MAG: hypothetical protein A3A80_02860 [Candidatus Terrybacteria bacterium RIFCSPLOWO2_01_FULL_44_24]
MDIVHVVYLVAVLILSIMLHEIAHGVAALKFGDTTAKDAGRLTLNPIPHIDPIGSIILPLVSIFLGGFIIGWAKPVPYNPLRFRNVRLGTFCVAIAGVATNLSLAVVAALCARLLFASGYANLVPFLALVVMLNLILAIFNLIPIPPFDGSKIVYSIFNLSYERQQRIEMTIGGFRGFFLIILLFMSGALSFVFNFAYLAASWLLGA